MDEQLKTNISSSTSWVRLLFIIFFAVCLQLASFVMGAVVIVQFLFVLISGERNNELRRFGASLAQYFFASLKYLTYNSDEKPFPFAEWPEPEGGEASTDEDAFAPAKSAPSKESSAKASTASDKEAPDSASSRTAVKKSTADVRAASGTVDSLASEDPVDPELTAEVVEEIKLADERSIEEGDVEAAPPVPSKPTSKRKNKSADANGKSSADISNEELADNSELQGDPSEKNSDTGKIKD